MGDTGDATHHAREEADASNKEEDKIAIAVGERFAVVDKGLEAVVQEHIGRAAAATKKLMASLVAGVQHVKEYVMLGNATGFCEILVVKDAVLSEPEKALAARLTGIQLSFEGAKSEVITRARVDLLALAGDTAQLSDFNVANGGAPIGMMLEEFPGRLRAEDADGLIALGWSETHEDLPTIAEAAIAAGKKLKAIEVKKLGDQSVVRIKGVGAVRPEVGPVTLVGSIRVWANAGDPDELMDREATSNRALLALTNAGAVEKAAGVRETGYELSRIVLTVSAANLRAVKAKCTELEARTLATGAWDATTSTDDVLHNFLFTRNQEKGV
jgi:hypothetical protein